MSWEDNKPFLRQESCWRCKFGHSTGTKCSSPGRITDVFCEKTRRWGKIQQACYCEKWVPNCPPELYYREDGIPVRNKTSLDYRTASQWESVGRYVKYDAEGLEMHPTMNGSKTYTYFLIEDTVESIEELESNREEADKIIEEKILELERLDKMGFFDEWKKSKFQH